MHYHWLKDCIKMKQSNLSGNQVAVIGLIIIIPNITPLLTTKSCIPSTYTSDNLLSHLPKLLRCVTSLIHLRLMMMMMSSNSVEEDFFWKISGPQKIS